MGDVKTYLVIGKISKPNLRTNFQMEVRALREDDAIEIIYNNLGSKHRLKRFEIKIERIEELDYKRIKDPNIKELTRRK